MEEFRRSKRAIIEIYTDKRGKIARLADTRSKPHSYIFKASFAKGAIEKNITADGGADANFMSATLMNQIEEKWDTFPFHALKHR